MDYHILVAYRNDDISWTNHIDPLKVKTWNTENEFETFIEHIIQTYDTLPSYTILLKGNPFQNNKYVSEQNIIQQIEKILSRFNGEQVCDAVPFFNQPTLENHYPTPEIRVPDYYYLFFDGDIPNQFEYNPQNQYILSRDSIKNRSKDFYLQLLRMIQNKHEHKRANKDSISYEILIRIFPYLFDMNVKDILI